MADRSLVALRACEACNAPFRPRPAQARIGAGRFCSTRCASTRHMGRPSEAIISEGRLTALIPLHDRSGNVVAYTKIDAVDLPLVNRWRWSLNGEGYVHRGTTRGGIRVKYLLHRVILGLEHGDTSEGDHVNRDILDNRRSNLRPLPYDGRPNQQNKRASRASASAYRGVHWGKAKKRWVASVKTQGKIHHLGYFADEQEAAEAARLGRMRLLPYATD